MMTTGSNSTATLRALPALRHLLRLAGSHGGSVSRGILLRFAQSACAGLCVVIVLDTIMTLTSGHPLSNALIWRSSAWMGGAFLGQLACGYGASRDCWISSYTLIGELRLKVLEKLRRLPMGFHVSHPVANTTAVLTGDMQMLENFVAEGLPRVAQALGMPVIVLLYLMWHDRAAGCAALLSIGAATPLLLWSARRLERLALTRQQRQARAGMRMIEHVRGMIVIRAFNRITAGDGHFQEALDEFRDISIRMVRQLVPPLVSFALVLLSGIPIVMFVGSLKYLGSAPDCATFVTTIVLVFSIYPPLLALASVMEMGQMAQAALTRIDHIMEAPCLPEPSAPKTPTGSDVTFRDVSFGYASGRTVLHHVSWTARAGAMTAIVGPSGAGKSTILALLARFWDVDAGRIEIGGIDIRDLGEKPLYRLVTAVFQDAHLFAGTLADNIALGRPGASTREIETAARQAQAHDFITALPDGYATRITEGGRSLSGGERQRIALARAILKDAPIVLLDEATAAIDPTNERAIQAALTALVAGKTLIVIAHKLSTIRAAEGIVVLDNGRVVQSGNHDTLVAQDGTYRKLWEHRMRAEGWSLTHEDREDETDTCGHDISAAGSHLGNTIKPDGK